MLIMTECITRHIHVDGSVSKFSKDDDQLVESFRLLVLEEPMDVLTVTITGHLISTGTFPSHYIPEHFLQVKLTALLNAFNQLTHEIGQLLVVELECSDVANVPLLLLLHLAQQVFPQQVHLLSPLFLELGLVVLEVRRQVDQSLIQKQRLEHIDDFLLLRVFAVVSL